MHTSIGMIRIRIQLLCKFNFDLILRLILKKFLNCRDATQHNKKLKTETKKLKAEIEISQQTLETKLESYSLDSKTSSAMLCTSFPRSASRTTANVDSQKAKKEILEETRGYGREEGEGKQVERQEGKATGIHSKQRCAPFCLQADKVKQIEQGYYDPCHWFWSR